jgi:hypothetical protein
MDDFSADDYVLTYTPTNADFSTRTVKGQGRHYVTSFFSVFGKHDYMVHGNSSISVKLNGRDVTEKSNTWRRWRIWSLTSDSGFNASIPPDSDWEDDNLTGNPNWLDIPGYLIGPSPDHWKTERKMLEFAVGVDPHLDAGGILYFFVIVSLKKNQYRVEMSSAKRIEYQDWLPLKHTQQPQSSGCTIQIDSTWLTAKVP